MRFIKKVITFATGKDEIERKQEAAANQIIRKKAIAAQLRERETQAIRFAKEREKVSYDRRIKALHNPKPAFNAFGPGLNNFFGGARAPEPVAQRVKTRVVPVKKGKKIVGYKTVRTKLKTRSVPAPQGFNVVSNGVGSGNFRVI
jgi:hypothetical protein